jgi:hypothetical protein
MGTNKFFIYFSRKLLHGAPISQTLTEDDLDQAMLILPDDFSRLLTLKSKLDYDTQLSQTNAYDPVNLEKVRQRTELALTNLQNVAKEQPNLAAILEDPINTIDNQLNRLDAIQLSKSGDGWGEGVVEEEDQLKPRLKKVLDKWSETHLTPQLNKMATVTAIQEGQAGAVRMLENIEYGISNGELLQDIIVRLNNQQVTLETILHQISIVINQLRNVPYMNDVCKVLRETMDRLVSEPKPHDAREMAEKLIAKEDQIDPTIYTVIKPIMEEKINQLTTGTGRGVTSSTSSTSNTDPTKVAEIQEKVEKTTKFIEETEKAIDANEPYLKDLVEMKMSTDRVQQVLSELATKHNQENQQDVEPIYGEISDLQNKLEDVKGDKLKMEENVAKINNELASRRDIINSDRQTMLQTLSNAGVVGDKANELLDQNAERIKVLNDELEMELAKLPGLDLKIAKLKETINGLYSKLSTCQQGKVVCEGDVLRCQTRLTEYDVNEKLLLNEIDLLKSRLESETAMKEKFMALHQQLTTEHEQLSEKFPDEQNQSLLVCTNEMKKLQEAHTRTINNLKKDIDDRQELILFNKDKINMQQQELDRLTQELAAKTKENSNMQRKFEEILQMRIDEEQRKCLEAIEEERKKFYQSETAVKKGATVVNDFKAECQAAKERIQSSKKEFVAMKEKLGSKIDYIIKVKKGDAKYPRNAYVKSILEKKQPLLTQKKADLANLSQAIDDINTGKPCTGAEDEAKKMLEMDNMLREQLANFEADRVDIADLYEYLRGVGRVYIRVKPNVPARDYTDQPTVSVMDGDELVNYQGSTYGPFNKVFRADASTNTVFNEIVDLLSNITNGYNVMLMTYGQSGSGKTFTLLGHVDRDGKVTEGLLGCCCSYLQALSYKISVKMFQLYTGSMYDIIDAPLQSLIEKKDVNKKFDLPPSTFSIDALKERDLASFSRSGAPVRGTDLTDYLTKRRCQRATLMNPDSSRSHAFINLSFAVTTPRDVRTVNVLFCDLGGNERIAEELEGDRREKTQKYHEGAYINLTLGELREIIQKFINGQQPQGIGKSIFGKVMQHYLNYQMIGNNDILNKIVIFIHVHGYYSPEEKKNEIIKKTTLNTLKFAKEMLSNDGPSGGGGGGGVGGGGVKHQLSGGASSGTALSPTKRRRIDVSPGG